MEQRAVDYLHVPKLCPQGGFPIKTEVIFDELGADPPIPEPVTATYKSPCPKRGGFGTGEEPETQPPPPQTALPGTGGAIIAPSSAKCVSRRDFVIHVQEIKPLVYRRVAVSLNGHAVKVINGTWSHARVDLRGLPKGSYTVSITVLATNGRRLHGTRTYHTCEPKPLPSKKPPL